MKKTFKKLPFLLVAFLLSGCNNNAQPLAGQVKKGKAITVQEAKEIMNDAAENMANEDTLSLTMKNGSYHYASKVENNYPKSKTETGTFKKEDSTDIKNIKMNLQAAGLSSDDLNNVKSSAGLKADVDIKGNIKSDNFEKTYSAPSGTMGFNVYSEGYNTYVDLSDTKLQSAISAKVNLKDDDKNYDKNINTTFSLDNKFYFDNGLSDENLPITSQENIDSMIKKITEEIEEIASDNGQVEAQQHDDGTYSYSVDLKNLKDNDEIMDEIPVDDDIFGYENTDFSSIFGNAVKTEKEHHFNVDTFAIAFVFDTTSIRSIGTTIDCNYTYTSTTTVNDITFKTNVTMEYKLDVKLEFASGKNATVEEVTDKDSYKKIEFDSDFDDLIGLFD